jgi:hypothetical protein
MEKDVRTYILRHATGIIAPALLWGKSETSCIRCKAGLQCSMTRTRVGKTQMFWMGGTVRPKNLARS